MNATLLIGGPLAMVVAVGFCIWSGIIVFEESETSFSDAAGLEIEQEPIEYREGDEPTHVRKLNGLNKYTNITIRRPIGFDAANWRFIFEREAALDAVREEYDEKLKKLQEEQSEAEVKAQADGEVEMYEIDPPMLVIPAR